MPSFSISVALRGQYNLATAGVSTFSTTGSISQGGNQLTVADASGFTTGDSLIVKIGGESGAGARGTVGVGGTWPDLSYANKTAMDLDTSKPNGTYSYRADTGAVYISTGGVWSPEDTVNRYYTASVIPRSLVATVSGKAGNVLTLGGGITAAVASSGATVYFDNAPRVATAIAGLTDNTTIVWPAGNYAMSASMNINSETAHTNMKIKGAGVASTMLFFPDGISNQGVIVISQATSPIVSDLTVKATARVPGYMMWAGAGATMYSYGISFSACPNVRTYDTKSIDAFQGGISLSACASPVITRHNSVLTEGLPQYVQWQILGANCTNGRYIDCQVNSAKLTGGIEWFASTGCSFENYTGVNASMSVNGSSNWTISNANITVQAGTYVSEPSFARNNPLININSNIGPSGAGTISNVTITQNAVVSSGNDTLRGIIVNLGIEGVVIDGGTITLPDYTAPSTLQGASGVNSDGVGTIVQNLTVIGAIKPAQSTYGNVTLNSTGHYHNITGTVVGGTPF